MLRRRRRTPALALFGCAAVLAGTALAGPSLPALPANETPYASDLHAAAYPVFDAKGRPAGKAKWHWTSAGGNCCETYVAATGKRLLEYGGSLPYVSDDYGKTWRQVAFLTPLWNGEGAIVGGPKGNIYGIGWDPYTGDHLQGVRYTAATKTWEVAEAPLKTPVFDREWITYAKGPFTLDGVTYPFLTIVRGGTATKQIELLSGDGISYTAISNPNAEAVGEPVRMSIPVVRNPDADNWQPNPGAYTVPLNAGGVLLINNSSDALPCAAARLNASTSKWECVLLPFVPKGTLRQDSRGWLTQAQRTSNDTIEVKVSKDGGRHWGVTEIHPPMDGNFEGGADFLDLKVNGKLGQAIVGTRVDARGGKGQDMVWRIDISTPKPRLLKTYYVGKGDLNTIIGLAGATSDRYDFPSIALFPNGRIAVSFDDSSTPKNLVRDVVPATNPDGHSPAVAILD